MTVWSLGTLLYVLLLGDIPYETTDHIIHNKPKKVLFDPYWQIGFAKSWKTHPYIFSKLLKTHPYLVRGLDEISRNRFAPEICQ